MGDKLPTPGFLTKSLTDGGIYGYRRQIQSVEYDSAKV